MTKHRGHGEGSVYQRASDGKWVAQFAVGIKDNGRPDLKYTYHKTRREAIAGLQQMVQDHKAGLPVTTARQKLADYLAEWLENSVKPTVRPRTYASYKQICELYIIKELGRHAIGDLSPQDIRAFLVRLSGKTVKRTGAPLSERTIRYCHSILRNALNDAVRIRLLGRNPATLVDPPRATKHEAKYLSAEQATEFLEATKGARLSCLYTLALTLGMRSGELLGLRWEDVDFNARQIRVRNSLQRIEGKLQLTEPKGGKTRNVALSKGAILALHAHKARQAEERLQAAGRWVDNGLVFPNTEGKPYDGGNMTRTFHQDLESAGLPRTNFHSMRHTCATLLLKQGVPMRVVMELLGHSQMSMTADLYSHVLPELKREAADRMDALFGTDS